MTEHHEHKDTDAPLRKSHAEAVEILNKPGRYNVLYRGRGATAIMCLNNDNQGYSVEEASALVRKMIGCKACS